MRTVIWQYSGENAVTLFDKLEASKQDVERIIRDVPGFVSYTLVRISDGGVSITVCNDKVGTDESPRRAAEWVEENMNVKIAPPEISEGKAILPLT